MPLDVVIDETGRWRALELRLADSESEVIWREVFDAHDLEQALADATALVAKLEDRRPALASWIEESIEACLTVFHLPPSHRRRLRSTNLLERLSKEISRRTRVVEIFPSP